MQLNLPLNLNGVPFYLVGIKGTGMAALAEVLHHFGADVCGSDVSERFFTDELLEKLQIPWDEDFNRPLPQKTKWVIHSAAYEIEKHPQLLEARQKGIPILGYHQALGSLSGRSKSLAVSGVHGKTTTTAMIGTILKDTGLSFSALVGSSVSNFSNSATLNQGQEYFVAEACEYRRHFLNFQPRFLLVTSIEADHLDYFKDQEDVYQAFLELRYKMASGSTLIYCSDDPGAARFGQDTRTNRPDMNVIGYGFKAQGDYQIQEHSVDSGSQSFYLGGYFHRFQLRIPGKHNVLNAAGALAAAITLWKEAKGKLDSTELVQMGEHLSGFMGTKRRSQIKYQHRGSMVIDDYGHHPTAIHTTLSGYREFYPDKRIIVSFMSHTYSRTAALLDDFSSAFSSADQVILHPIYASARETNTWGISGKDLYERMKEKHSNVLYFEDFEAALEYVKSSFSTGDVFVTMGAGNNWEIGDALIQFLQKPASGGAL